MRAFMSSGRDRTLFETLAPALVAADACREARAILAETGETGEWATHGPTWRIMLKGPFSGSGRVNVRRERDALLAACDAIAAFVDGAE